jgi:hypothetical protein
VGQAKERREKCSGAPYVSCFGARACRTLNGVSGQPRQAIIPDPDPRVAFPVSFSAVLSAHRGGTQSRISNGTRYFPDNYRYTCPRRGLRRAAALSLLSAPQCYTG